MSLEAAIVTRVAAHAGLAALISTRIYPEMAPQEATAPFLVFERVSTLPRPYVFGTATPQFVTARMQFDCFAATHVDVMALADQVRSCFDRWQGTVGGQVIQDSMIDNEMENTELEDTTTQLRRRTFDFIMTYTL